MSHAQSDPGGGAGGPGGVAASRPRPSAAAAVAAPRLLLLADDLTGACDAAVAFTAGPAASPETARTRREVLVALEPLAMWPDDIAVLAIDLDVRERSVAAARARIAAALRPLAGEPAVGDGSGSGSGDAGGDDDRGAIGSGREPKRASGSVAPSPGTHDRAAAVPEQRPVRLFVKIDSTLRGPLAGLVDGALEATGLDVAIVAPAVPDLGRLVQDGRVYVNGQPGASVLDRLGTAATALIAARGARTAPMLAAAVERARRRGARRVVVDADGPGCLASVAQAATEHADWLLVGSAGLAQALRTALDAGGDPRSAESRASTVDVEIARARPASATLATRAGPDGPVLVVAGSPAAATRAQVARLSRLVSPQVVRPAAPALAAPLDAPRLLVLCAPPADEHDARQSSAAGGQVAPPAADEEERDGGESAAAVAAVAADWARRLRPSALVVTGGATARALFGRLGARGIRLLVEVSPGVVLGALVGGTSDGALVVTKAGGFGGPDTLVDVVHWLGALSPATSIHLQRTDR